MHSSRPRRRLAVAFVALASVVLAACSSSGSPSGTTVAKSTQAKDLVALKGGTAYFAEQPETPPDYIFPLVSGAYFTGANTSDLQTLLYEPLFWFGDKASTSIDYPLSVGNAPVYSDGDRVVTITLKHYLWSDGETVSARDVIFWINLLKANPDDWASYVPGGFPDNVVSATAPNATTVRLKLNAAYNPIWYTYNELSQITPLPIAWDRTSLTAPVPKAGQAGLPDTTPSGARAVYKFLNAQASEVSSYASSPIWSVVDGPWRLTGLTTEGTATFVPNPHFSGPDKPRLAKFVELPYTICRGRVLGASGRADDGGPGIVFVVQPDLGRLCARQRPAPVRSASVRGISAGRLVPLPVRLLRAELQQPDCRADPAPALLPSGLPAPCRPAGLDPRLLRRPRGAHLRPGAGEPCQPLRGCEGVGEPLPVQRSDGSESSHRPMAGRSSPGGLTTCARPGHGRRAECGKAIRAGEGLNFTLMYPSGLPYTDGSMVDLQSVAKQVGIEISLKEVTPTTIASTILTCSPGPGRLQLGARPVRRGLGLRARPLSERGGDLRDRRAWQRRQLLEPDHRQAHRGDDDDPAAGAKAALDAYQDQVRLELPNFWQPSPGTLVTVQSNLRGFVPNAYGFISPEEWYFTKA